MASTSTELERTLIGRVKREGRITFRDFMQAALYDPVLGYYNTERLKIGPEGDYYTSANVHPAFGALLAHAFVELAGEQNHTLVELGAGTGQLAFDVLSTMREEHPSVFEHITYIIVETSPAMRIRQRAKLADWLDRVRWLDLEELERAPLDGIVFSNELIDAMPVHCVRHRHRALEELYVTLSSHEGPDRLGLSWGPASTERLNEYVQRMGVRLEEAQVVEVNLDAVGWLSRMSRSLSHGLLITIDYGDIALELWSAHRSRGTLRSFYRHRLVDSPLERIGEQDITASVNFTALVEYGRDFGFELVSYERQTAFLIRMGLIERIAAQHNANDTLDDLKQRLAVKNFFVPGGVSETFRVLVQRKHAPW